MWSKCWSSSSVVSGTPPSTNVIADESKYLGTRRARAVDVATETSDGFMTTALPAAMAPATGTSSNWIG